MRGATCLGETRAEQRFVEEGQLGGWHGAGKGRKESRGIIWGKTAPISGSEEHQKMGDGYENARQTSVRTRAQPKPPVSASLRPGLLLISLTQEALQGPKDEKY